MTAQVLPGSISSKQCPTGSGCPVCGRDIVFSAFFDRFGFNAWDNTTNLTNIGLMFRKLSFADNTEITKEISSFRTTWNYTHYITGLGTPHKPEQQYRTGAQLVLESAVDKVKDQPKDKAKELGKEVMKGNSIRQGMSDMLKKRTGTSTLGWKKNWERFNHHRSVVAAGANLSAKQVSTAARLAKKHAMDVPVGARKMGKSLARGLVKEVAMAAALAVVESTDAADTPMAAKLFRTGYKKRISDTWEVLAAVIRREKDNIKPPTQTCCGEVRVFIFGADWGGTLARIFANKVVKECEKKDGKLSFEGVPVRLCFVGLFDCANSVTVKKGLNFALGFTPMKAELDDTKLPAEVEAAFHLYAAHERGYMAASILGGKAVKQEECALPGIATDVCGGKLLKSEYGLAHLDIAKYALCQMHAVATGYAGPFGKPDDGTRQSTNLEAALKPDFLLNGQDVYEHLSEYQRVMGDLSAAPMSVIRQSGESYTKWLRMLYDESQQGRDLAMMLKTNGKASSAFLEAIQTQVQHADYEAHRGLQLAERAWEHQLGKVWQSGVHLDDPILHAFFATYMHFNCPSLPLSYREVEG